LENFYIAVTVALTTLVTSTIGPVVIAIVNYRTARADKLIEWARQDEVARRLEAHAVDAKEQRETLAAQAETHRDVMDKKLDVVHSLVNSQLQAALAAEHDALEGQLTLITELIELRKTQGASPSEETIKTIEKITQRLDELRTRRQEASSYIKARVNKVTGA
jgi:hypothetical protein